MRGEPGSVRPVYAQAMKTMAVVAGCLILAGRVNAQPTTSPAAKAPPPAVQISTGPDRVNWWNDRVFYEIQTLPDSGDLTGNRQLGN